MSFIDDNYLDGVITLITREHRDILMRTAKRLNLPDDDVLFLYIGAIEYTVQLCEDILKGISNERLAIEQSVLEANTTSTSQAEAILKSLIQVAKSAATDIKTSGMAATSAIASANGEVLNQSRATVIEAVQLKDQITDLITEVNRDRQTNIDVLNVLNERIGKLTGGLETAIQLQNQANQYIQKSNTDIQKLKKSTAFAQFIGSFSPLIAIGVAMVAGGLIWAWGMHVYWGPAEKYLPVSKKNQAAFDKCFNEQGLVKIGMDCEILYKKVNKAKK